MAVKKGLAVRLETLERKLQEIEERIDNLDSKVESESNRIRNLSKRMDTRIKREEIVMAALGMDSRTKKGDKGLLGELNQSILKLEEYLLRTSERIDNILNSLRNHREFLVKMNKRVFKIGTKERIKMELDIMKNTLSILAMNGVDFDSSLPRDIEKLKEELQKEEVDIGELRKRKEKLDKKFDGELNRFDLESLYIKRKVLPGYG